MLDVIPFYGIIRECSFSVKMFLFFSTIVEKEGQNGKNIVSGDPSV
jgi:hypothetical protein